MLHGAHSHRSAAAAEAPRTPQRSTGHSHPHPPPASGAEAHRRLLWVWGLTIAFMGLEAVGGIVSGSIALLADAGHMLSDASAIGLSLLAARLMRWEVTHRRTFGYRRAELLAAFVNALALVVLALWIVAEAVQRLGDPRPVLAGVMFWVAVAGLAVNALGIALLHRHAAADLNLKSAVWHITGDLLGSLGAVVGAVVIYWTGWTPIDALLSIGIAVLIGAAGGRILYDSANLLLDRVPAEIDTAEVRAFLVGYQGVRQICDLHIWGVSSTETMLTAHLVVADDIDRDALLQQLLRDLQARFGLAHMTLQLEAQPDASCDRTW